ncbi:flagellar basal body-associated FliL family protein [Paenibacillus marinisediminis]
MKRIMPWMITMLLAITLIALVFIMVINNQNNTLNNQNTSGEVHMKRLTADDILEVTSVMNDIKTNLAGNEYIVQIGFSFQMDSPKTLKEFEKIKDIKVKPVILKTLADMTPEELEGTKGKDQLSAKLLDQINKILPQGKVIQVEVNEFMMVRA